MTGALIRGGHVFTAEGALAGAAVRFEDGMITAVGDIIARPGERIIEAAGCTVIPGLIDAHSHLTHFEHVEDRSPAHVAFRSAARAREALKAGVTSVRDIGSHRRIDVELRAAIRAGLVVGPTMKCAGSSISTPGGHSVPRAQEADGPDAVRRAVREQLAAGADFVKLNCSGGVMGGASVMQAQLTRAEIEAAVDEAALAGTTVSVHAHPPEAIKRAVQAGVRSVEHGSFLDEECAGLMAEHGAFLTPTFAVYATIGGSGSTEVADAANAILSRKVGSFRRALDAGVAWAVGSDCGVLTSPSTIAAEIDYLVREVGLAPSDVLSHATAGNADLLGFDGVGQIAIGLRADLAVLRGDPLSDIGAIRNVRLTIVGGVVHDWEHEYVGF